MAQGRVLVLIFFTDKRKSGNKLSSKALAYYRINNINPVKEDRLHLSVCQKWFLPGDQDLGEGKGVSRTLTPSFATALANRKR